MHPTLSHHQPTHSRLTMYDNTPLSLPPLSPLIRSLPFALCVVRKGVCVQHFPLDTSIRSLRSSCARCAATQAMHRSYVAVLTAGRISIHRLELFRPTSFAITLGCICMCDREYRCRVRWMTNVVESISSVTVEYHRSYPSQVYRTAHSVPVLSLSIEHSIPGPFKARGKKQTKSLQTL